MIAEDGEVLVRLHQPLGSRVSRAGSPISAEVIEPVAHQGVRLEGRVTQAAALGRGLKRMAAELRLEWTAAVSRDGERAAVRAITVGVDAGREAVDASGVVRGVAPGWSVGSPVAVYAWRLWNAGSFLAWPVFASKFAFAPFPDPEIYLPAGAELWVEVESGLPFAPAPPSPAAAPAPEVESWTAKSRGRRGDPVNVALHGSRAQVEQAFAAAGWRGARGKTPLTVWRTFLRVIQNRPYADGPMSAMHLTGRPANLQFQKSLNTYGKRHHIRLWALNQEQSLWAGAAVEDIAVRIDWRRLRFTHGVDPKADRERDRVVADLAWTGAVLGYTLQPRELRGAGKWVTDGGLAVVELGANRPVRIASNPAEHARPRGWGPRWRSFGMEVFRTNPASVGYHLAQSAVWKLRGAREQAAAFR